MISSVCLSVYLDGFRRHILSSTTKSRFHSWTNISSDGLFGSNVKAANMIKWDCLLGKDKWSLVLFRAKPVNPYKSQWWRISPHDINTKSREGCMRIKKMINFLDLHQQFLPTSTIRKVWRSVRRICHWLLGQSVKEHVYLQKFHSRQFWRKLHFIDVPSFSPSSEESGYTLFVYWSPCPVGSSLPAHGS